MRLLPIAFLALGLSAPAAAASSAATTALAARGPSPPAGPKLCPAAVRAIDAAASRTMKQGSPGMIVEVARDGRLLFSGAYGLADIEQRRPVTRDTVFKLASITKEFTAALILSLAEEGRIDLAGPIAGLVPELPAAGRVRIYDLLVHGSGIPDYSEDPVGLAVFGPSGKLCLR